MPENVRAVRARIAAAALKAGRPEDSVTLLGVGKAHSAAALRAAANAGLRQFGENYLREALEKQNALRDLDLTWHFIGQLQTNKTRPVAEHFAWVHGVDRLRLAERLAEQRPAGMPPLNVCIQVNLGGESSKGGVSPAELPALATAIAQLPHLKLRGLMALPPAEDEPIRQRQWFAQLRQLQESLNSTGAGLDTLSMGMSGDLEAAVLEGSTIVRVGTALFGPRRTSDAGA